MQRRRQVKRFLPSAYSPEVAPRSALARGPWRAANRGARAHQKENRRVPETGSAAADGPQEAAGAQGRRAQQTGTAKS